MTENNIIPDATRFTTDSRASDRRATDPERAQAKSFSAKMNMPPARDVSAALLFLNSQSIPTLLPLGVSPEASGVSRRIPRAARSRQFFDRSDEKGVLLTQDS
jgi:hypothetical protein